MNSMSRPYLFIFAFSYSSLVSFLVIALGCFAILLIDSASDYSYTIILAVVLVVDSCPTAFLLSMLFLFFY